MSPHELLRLIRASESGNPHARRAIDLLEERATYGDAWAHRALFQARALANEGRIAKSDGYFPRVGGDNDSVRAETKGNTTVITVATPSAGSNFVAYILGAFTVAAGIFIGVFLPGIIRRQASK